MLFICKILFVNGNEIRHVIQFFNINIFFPGQLIFDYIFRLNEIRLSHEDETKWMKKSHTMDTFYSNVESKTCLHFKRAWWFV